MADAAAGMARALANVQFADPRPPLLANADARPIREAGAARSELVAHLTTGVDWIAAVERMLAEGVTSFVEVGPGKVLTGLIRRIAPDATVLATDDQSAPGGLAVPFLSQSGAATPA
jgi:[acyl-carrier-protein] S-malonyltransferase